MKKLIERLLLFFLGLPLFVASVFFLPYYGYLFLQIEILLFTVFGIYEMRSMLKLKLPVISLPLSVLTGMLVPIAAFMYAVFDAPYRVITFSLSLACLIVFFAEFLDSFSGSFEKATGRIASSLMIIIYPGYLVTYVTTMTIRENAGALLSVFFMMVFFCDSLAWFFGMLFGKGNRGLIPASPNKSLLGFFGGYFGSISAGVLSTFLFPEVYGGHIRQLVIIGFFTATAAIIGDIVESVLKRSTGIKDSGSLVPGRGGVLDSMDSILLAAPVFYILTDIFFGS